jgi:hypothetical protein
MRMTPASTSAVRRRSSEENYESSGEKIIRIGANFSSDSRTLNDWKIS